MKIQTSVVTAVMLGIVTLSLSVMTGCKKDDRQTNEPEEKGFVYKGTITPLLEGRMSMTLFQEGNFTCFVGGNLEPYGANLSSNIDVYNKERDNWTTYSMTGQRTKPAFALVRNTIIVAGGRLDNRDVDLVDVIDLPTGHHSTAKLGLGRYEAAAAGLGPKVLIAGGWNGGFSNRVDVYDLDTKTMTTSAPLTVPRGNMAAAAAGDKILFAGGDAGTNINYDNLDIYDVRTGNWVRSKLAQARTDIKVMVVGPRIFFIGGLVTWPTAGGKVYSEYIDIYNTTTNQLTNIRIPQNRMPMSVCANDSKLFICSGSSAEYPFIEKLNIYDIESNQLKTVPVPEGRILTGLATIGPKVIMAGGTLADQMTFSDKITVYDMNTDAFDVSTFKLPNKLAGAVAATVGDKLFIVSGFYINVIAQQVIPYRTVSEYAWKL